MTRRRKPPSVYVLSLVVLFFGCPCGDEVTAPPRIERLLTVVTGARHDAMPSVALPVVVRYQSRTVTGDIAGAYTPSSGVRVFWSSSTGGTFTPSESVTNSDGEASTAWTPSRQTRSAYGQARILDHGGHVAQFSAELYDPILEKVSGDSQTAHTRTELPNPVVLRLMTDADAGTSVPVANQVITWTVTDGGSVTPTSSTTDAQGMVSARWTLGTARQAKLTASASGPRFLSAANDQFVATARFTTFELRKVAGDSQSAQPGQLVSDSVLVEYASINESTNVTRPVAGALIRWVPTPTANGVAVGAAIPATSVTDQQGRAWTRWRLGPNPGQQTMFARTALVDTAGPDSDSVAFFIAIGGLGSRLRVVSGNMQSAVVGSPLPGSLLVEYVDINAATGAVTPIVGASISWSVLSGGGSLSGTTTATDALGRANAEWTLGSVVGTQTVRASTPAAQAPPGSIVDADFTATATPAATPPARMAYTVVNQNGGAEAPYTFNSRGGSITASHTGVGIYRVLLTGQGTPAGGKETIQVSPYGSREAYCKLGGWTNSGIDMEVTVLCFNPGGNAVDGAFSLLLLDNAAVPGRYAFAHANDAAAASYTPANTFSARQPIVITRSGPGQYDVQFTGSTRAAGDLAEAVLMTPVGSNGTVCSLDDAMVAATVRVHCWQGPNDELTLHADQPFSIALIERGRPGNRAATAWVRKSRFANTRTLPSDSASSTGGSVRVERTDTEALSILTFRGLGRVNASDRENVQLIGVEDEDASYCKIVNWTSIAAASGADLEVKVQCFHEDGDLDDLSFYIVVIQ